ncbi:MAG: exopolysaccharide biosynthesis polyprenyl glycosylphosphotransferase [Polyangiaceae bacterium]|nr:exopolysaccharide biosynthesis polyprenyl glycosylphosphotransferase [Polyangiaceae bacterium]
MSSEGNHTDGAASEPPRVAPPLKEAEAETALPIPPVPIVPIVPVMPNFKGGQGETPAVPSSPPTTPSALESAPPSSRPSRPPRAVAVPPLLQQVQQAMQERLALPNPQLSAMPSPPAPFAPTLSPIGAAPGILRVPPTSGAPPPPASSPEDIARAAARVKAEIAAPVIRIPQGNMLGGSRPVSSPRSGTLICEILIANGAVTPEAVEKALAIQEERGGQIGRILVSNGACSEEAIARALAEQLRVRMKAGNAETDISAAARSHKDVAGLQVLTRPIRTMVTLFVTDVFSLVLAALVASSVHFVRTYSAFGEFDWSAWLVVGPSICLCVLTFAGLELYSPMAKSTPDELRDIVFATSLVHFGASLLATLGGLPIVEWGIFVRAVWWLSTMLLVTVIRSAVRNALCVQPWWGIPVCVLGAAKTGRLVVRTLKAQPRSGLKPVMLLDDDPAKHGTLRASFTNEVMDVYSINVSASHFMSEAQRSALAADIFGTDSDDDPPSGPISSDHIIPPPPASWRAAAAFATSEEFLGPESQINRPTKPKEAALFPRGKFAEVDGIPVVGDLSLAPVLAQRLKIPYAVVAMPGVDSPKLLQIVERVGGKFSHLLVIPDLFGFATLGVPAKSLGGILGVEVRQQLLLPGPRLAKRVMDVALTGFGIFVVLPFLLLVALLIKLDSKGPLFYTQKRLGRDGEHFKAYKFRTMHGDGEERLKALLDDNPELRAEYEIYHKLRKDPRVTRIGRFLRKFSLDEFPQLLNVIKGDMSLVGPRPYIERELTEMGGKEKIILRAPPGMTGMWQVSDRNATSFAQRVQIDVYYVRNWSPWLDIHILAKTVGVVLKGSGV